MTKKKKARSHPKELYRIRNWSAYDAALVNRGSLTIWISEIGMEEWSGKRERKGRGRPKAYSDLAIETALTLKEVFHLTNRATEGFLRSIFTMMGIAMPVPDHTTLSRRSKGLKVSLPKSKKDSLNVVVDSTGLKVYGEGEWKMRKHGKSKRRTWRKLHLGVNPQSNEIETMLLSKAGMTDGDAAIAMIEEMDQPIEQYTADGAYDKRKVYKRIKKHSANCQIIIPPRKDARIWQHGNSKKTPHPRDVNLRYIRKHGRKAWKRDSNYHQRSLAETAMFRMKTIFGDHLSNRLLDTQCTQATIRCRALNIMTQLGMPDSYLVS